MSNQLEEDLRRVLRLARTEARTRRLKVDRKTNTIKQQRSEPQQRHRHDRLLTVSREERTTLLTAKLKGLSAIYGLENTSRHLGDCSSKSVLHHHQQDDPEEDDEILQQRFDSRRALYKQHYTGALAGASGQKRKLEHLFEAAAREARSSRAMGVGIGAAILTSTHTIYSARAVESNAMALCAERAVVLKMLTSGTLAPTIEALAICSEQQEMLPFPCGSCRELLADCGDFPVYLVNALGESEETRSSDLFPRARHSELTQRLARIEPSSNSIQNRTKTFTSSSEQAPLEVKDWTTEDVLRWLEQDVELAQYRDVFERNAVDGCTLVLLEASDLQLLLGITHPLHRTKLLTHVDRLRDRELLARGLDYTQLEDYLAVLDIDRVSAVGQLKTTFDRLDADHDGFLDFKQVKQALSRLRCTIPAKEDLAKADSSASSVEVSAQAVERLLHSETLFGKEAASSGKVSFPAFVRAFSKLATQPADTAAVTQGAFAVHAVGPRLPVLDLKNLHICFEQRAGNSSLGEAGLIEILQELGQTQANSSELARQWLQIRDEVDEVSETLNFAEFIVRYAQLVDSTAANREVEATGVARLQQLFTSFEPVHSAQWKPRSVVQRALSTLFPSVPRDEVNVWCATYWPAKLSASNRNGADGSGDNQNNQTITTMNFPEFTQACLEFAAEVHTREQEASSIKRSLRNDALSHRSRVVHLHHSGHVRMCPQLREHATEASGKLKGPKKTKACKQHETRRGFGSDDDDGKLSDGEGKFQDSDDDENKMRQTRERGQRERKVDEVFDRFAQRHTTHTCSTKYDDSKHNNDEDEDNESSMLNAVEVAQAALELGAAFSREQMMRFLEREGLGRLRRRDISRAAFHRLIKRLDANQAHPREFLLELEDISLSNKRNESPAKARSSSKSPRHLAYKSKMDYDEFLRQQHALQNGSQWEKEVDALRRQQQRKERRQYKKHRKHRHRSSRHRSSRGSSDDDGKHDSDSERANSTSSESSYNRSSDEDRVHRREKTTRNSRSRSRSSHLHNRRSRRHRSTTSDTSTATDTSSNESGRSSAHRPARRRGFEPGARVASMVHGRGTIERVYRDYFVADVHFDSGRHVRNVEFSGMRVLTPEDEQLDGAPKRGLNVGSLVTVAHKGTKTRRRGKIVLCRTDGTFDILVNEFGQAQTLKRIERSALAFANSKLTVYREGARVTVRQKSEYLRGRVCVRRTDGLYDVKLVRSPQKVLQRLAPELLSPDDEEDRDSDDDIEVTEKLSPTTSKETSRSKQKESDDDFEPEFSRGDRVEARFGGQATYYPGTIERVHSNGMCDISYDDGDDEERVAPRLIRALPRAPGTGKSTTPKKKSGNDSDGYESDFFESD